MHLKPFFRLSLVALIGVGQFCLAMNQPNIPNNIFAAIEAGNLEAVKAFLKPDFNINCVDSYGATPLHCASFKGNQEIIEMLLSSGASVNCASLDEHGSTALHWACTCSNPHLGTIKALLDHGADANYANNYGATPLHKACFKGHQAVVKILLAYGADVDCANNNGKTALNEASIWNNSHIVQSASNEIAKRKINGDRHLTVLHQRNLDTLDSIILFVHSNPRK